MTPVPQNDSDVSTCPGQTVSLAEATAAFADATAAFNRALSCWWRLSDEEMAAASERFWVAQRDFQAAISEPAEAAS